MLYLAYLKTMGYQIFSRSEKHVLWNLTLKSTSPFKRHYLILIEVKVEIPMLPILDFFKFYIFIKFLSVLEPLNTPVSTFNWNHKSNYLKVDKYLLGIVSVSLSTLNKDLSLKCPNYRTPAEGSSYSADPCGPQRTLRTPGGPLFFLVICGPLN